MNGQMENSDGQRIGQWKKDVATATTSPLSFTYCLVLSPMSSSERHKQEVFAGWVDYGNFL